MVKTSEMRSTPGGIAPFQSLPRCSHVPKRVLEHQFSLGMAWTVQKSEPIVDLGNSIGLTGRSQEPADQYLIVRAD